MKVAQCSLHQIMNYFFPASDAGSSKLAEFEAVVLSPKTRSREKAQALRTICELSLYYPQYGNFHEYQTRHLGISCSQSFYLLGCLKVYENICSVENLEPPKKFSHCRPLITLNKSEQIKVWRSAQECAAGGQITLRLIKEVMSQVRMGNFRDSVVHDYFWFESQVEEFRAILKTMDFACGERNVGAFKDGFQRLERILKA